MLETVRVLDADHLEPVTMVLREPTLDDVFLELTGHTRSDDEEAPTDTDRRRGRMTTATPTAPTLAVPRVAAATPSPTR